MSLQNERKLTVQMQSDAQKKDNQIRELQDEIKTLMAQKQAASAQQLLEKSGADSKFEELTQSHKAELKKLTDQHSDLQIELTQLQEKSVMTENKLHEELKEKESEL